MLGEFQANLNKLTLENFSQIFDKMKHHNPASLKEYRSIIDLIYNKAIMEPHFAPMYARLCHKLNKHYPLVIEKFIYTKQINDHWICCERGSNTPLCEEHVTEEAAKKDTMMKLSVRKILAEKCQREMESEGKTVELEKQRQEIKAKLRTKSDNALLLQFTEIEFEINTIRRHTFGNIQFIGELFNCGLLRKPDVIKACFNYLITPPENADEEKTEALCKLLHTVGKTMYNNVVFAPLLQDAMEKIEPLANTTSITMRVRFAVRDLIDLAQNMWVSDQKDKLEKLSSMRMEQTIKKLQSILE